MLKIVFVTFTILLSQIGAQVNLTDDLNNSFEFEKSPSTIVTLAPNLTEFIYLLDLQDKLVGNTSYCDFPPESKQILKVGDLISVDYEKVIEIKPDVIFITVEGNSKTSFDRLVNLGFKVFVSNPRDYKGIKKTLLDIARIFNRVPTAENIIEKWDVKYNDIYEEAKLRDSLSAFFLISYSPIIPASGKTFLNEFLTGCNLFNLASFSNQNYPVISREAFLNFNADMLIVAADKQMEISELTEIYPEWKNITAIKKRRVVFVEPNLFFRPGPRFIEALESLNEKLTDLH